MISLSLCLLAFVASWYAARRSLTMGLSAVFTFGYLYGILRANIPQAASHFIFDAAVAGLYLGFFSHHRLDIMQRNNWQILKPWLFLLMGWPTILFLIPIQDLWVQLVGLRGNIFMLPFLVLGAFLDDKAVYRLMLWLAVLNCMAFVFAVAEFFLGVERFIPLREGVTDIVYRSTDVGESRAFRIPACFANAHVYGGTMLQTIPLLLGAWLQRNVSGKTKTFFLLAIAISIIGVFLCAARTPVVRLFVLLAVLLFSFRLKMSHLCLILLVLAGVVRMIATEERLQRFATLGDTEAVRERIYGSVNEGFFDLAVNYPMGNGLGGGGTSLPYFLQDRLKNVVLIENEYGRILLEQGLVGLFLWIAFIVWAITRRTTPPDHPWFLPRRLTWVLALFSFVGSVTGIGMLTSIPGTALFLLTLGWIVVPVSRAER